MSRNKQQIKKAITDLKNDLYYEKLGSMLSRIRAWISDKDRFTKQNIIDKNCTIFNDNTTICQKLNTFSHVFVQFIQQISSSLVNYDTEHVPKRRNSISSKKNIKPINENRINYLQKPKQIWQTRRQQMKKIKQFSQMIVPGIKRQSSQNYRLLSQLQSQVKKTKTQIQKTSTQYMKKIELASIKNNQKQFQFNRIKQISNIYQIQLSECEQTMSKFLEINKKLHQNQFYMMETLDSNMFTLSQIINACFKGFQNIMVQQAKYLMDQVKKMANQIQVNIINNERLRKSTMLGLKESLQSISKQLFQQISVASWVIQSKTADQELFANRKGIITIDNKFLVLKDDEKQVQNQINLIEATFDETQVLGQLYLKPKKKSSICSKMLIKFEKPQNQDQFKLHMKKAKEQIQ